MPHTLTLENGTVIELAPLMLDMGPGDPVDFYTLPLASLNAYGKEANTHVFGNRASSDLVRKIKEAIRDAGGKDDKGEYNVKLADVTGDQVKAFRADEANAKVIEALADSIAAEYRDKVLAGELAASTRSPGMSAETKAQREAARRVVEYLLGQKSPPMCLPTGKGAPAIVKEILDNFLANKAGMLTKNKRRFDTTLAAVKAEAVAAATPKVKGLADLFGDDEGADASDESKAAE